jgi:hypothetical protein
MLKDVNFRNKFDVSEFKYLFCMALNKIGLEINKHYSFIHT